MVQCNGGGCGIDFELEDGKVLGLVGESGSGKSATAPALIGLLGPEDKSPELFSVCFEWVSKRYRDMGLAPEVFVAL